MEQFEKIEDNLLSLIKNITIDEKMANDLFNIEIDNLAPNEEIPGDEYMNFINEVVGKTIWEYCMWRHPDNPDEQLLCTIKFINTKNW